MSTEPVQPVDVPLDALLTPEQFCEWAGVSREWFTARVNRLPGVIRHSRQNIRIHPRTYLEQTIQKDTK